MFRDEDYMFLMDMTNVIRKHWREETPEEHAKRRENWENSLKNAKTGMQFDVAKYMLRFISKLEAEEV